jgi:choline monooxygenase
MDLPPFETNLARATTLPARCYTDAGIFALERERIFARTWQPVGRTDQLRSIGDFLTAEVAGEPVVVLRDLQGELRAFANVCRHRAGAVAEGCGNRKTLQCSYHGWTYDLHGGLLAAPEFDGVENFAAAQCRLPSYAVAIWGPLVFVNLDTQAPALDTVLGAIVAETRPLAPERLVLAERRDYLVRCNWKVYIDNYLEGYHIPMAHPGLFREVDYPAYRVETFRYYSRQYAPLRPVASSKLERGSAQDEGDRRFTTGSFPTGCSTSIPGTCRSTLSCLRAPSRP